MLYLLVISQNSTPVIKAIYLLIVLLQTKKEEVNMQNRTIRNIDSPIVI